MFTAIAPGRVNLLGEHTDYSGGMVLPMALDLAVTATASRREDGVIALTSDRFPGEVLRFSADSPPPPGGVRWARYALGVVAEIWPRADLRGGFDLRIESALPMGAGLGSSASLAVACAKALNNLFGCGLGSFQLALACQRAERCYAGVACGLMDQAAAALLSPGEALVLDCRTLDWTRLPLPRLALAVVPSGVSHALAESGYNQRVAECSELETRLGRSLGELSPARLPDLRRGLPAPLDRRLTHVLDENARVRAGVTFLASGDLPAFGRLMFDSHASLRDLHEVSCPELDALVERLRPFVHGAKMTGAGFGGAVVALLAPERVQALRASVPVEGMLVVETQRVRARPDASGSGSGPARPPAGWRETPLPSPGSRAKPGTPARRRWRAPSGPQT
jgi:galactokinase